jgi:hypothetical protein
VRFELALPVDVPPARAAAAYGSPSFYGARASRSDISVREVLDREERGGTVVIRVRFAFTGSVSSAVRAVVDPVKMTWVTRTEIEPAEARANWEVLPDHYPDRLHAQGTYRFAAGEHGPGSTVVHVDGDLKVHVPFVGGSVERAIVSGLRSYLEDQVASLPAWTA